MPSTGKAESAKNKKMLGQQVRTAIEALHAENEELKKDLARETPGEPHGDDGQRARVPGR